MSGPEDRLPAHTWTDADFEGLSWHDCHIWGVRFEAGDGEAGDWTSDFALDVDVIVEWICGTDGAAQFRVAPATLTFHGVTDPRVDVDWGGSGFQTALHPISIDRIEREAVIDQKVYLDRPYYRWRIALNWPARSAITLGAYGFTQVLRKPAILTTRQHLSRNDRGWA